MSQHTATYVGIDVSKQYLDVHIRPRGERLRIDRDETGLEQLVTHLSALEPALVVFEATGGLQTRAAGQLGAAGLPVAVVNPRQVRDFGRSTGRLAKTDAIDAEIIAHFAEATKPTPRPLPDEAAQALQALVARRRELVAMRSAEKNRLKTAPTKRVQCSIEAVIETINAQLEELDLDLDDAVRESPIWRTKEDLLTSVPGVGTTTARVLIAELPELGDLSRRRIAALAGLAPFNRDSGQMRGRRTIWGGRRTVRTALYMATISAIRSNPQIAETYKRLRNAGKPPKLAITACMRKLLIVLNAILRDQTPWSHA